MLQDRVVVVTGATSGIGRATALRCAALGAQVVATGRDEARGAAVVAAARAAGGVTSFVAADLTRAADAQALATVAFERHGRVDGLVCAAGVFPVRPTAEVTSADLIDIFRANVSTVFLAGQALIPHLVASGRGRVVVVTSIAAHIGGPGLAIYCASKGALDALVRAWALEFAEAGVTVNAVAPGNIETPMNEHLMADPAYVAALLERTPIGRNGQPEEVAAAIAFLLGNEAAFITGSTLTIDGGWTAQ